MSSARSERGDDPEVIEMELLNPPARAESGEGGGGAGDGVRCWI